MNEPSAIRTLIATRKPFHHESVPFILFWSQKAGCTTLLKWFLFHAGLLDEAMRSGAKPGRVRALHRYEKDVFQARDGYDDELVAKISAQFPAINFVRCPYERAFSSYLHIHNPVIAEVPNWKSPLHEARRRVLDSLFGPDVSIEHAFSFRDYLIWLNDQDDESLDPHLRPQNNRLFEMLPVTHYRLDDFDNVTAWLETKSNLHSSTGLKEKWYASEHHIEKRPFPRETTLAYLTDGLPLRRQEGGSTPRVTRELLVGTDLDDLIKKRFSRDISLYQRALSSSEL